MKIKPILFNTEMVRAILEDRKTVTRRVVKFLPGFNPKWTGYIPDGPVLYGSNNIPAAKPPYRPDDILYVRETFRVDYLSNIPGAGRIQYKADRLYRDFSFAPARYDMMRRAQLKPGWCPNENMPREAARIFLRVTGVRAERLRDITEEQAEKEGAKAWMVATTRDWGKNPNYVLAFRHVWDSTIKPADRALYGWEANPWCWVIGIKRISKESVDDEQTD